MISFIFFILQNNKKYIRTSFLSDITRWYRGFSSRYRLLTFKLATSIYSDESVKKNSWHNHVNYIILRIINPRICYRFISFRFHFDIFSLKKETKCFLFQRDKKTELVTFSLLVDFYWQHAFHLVDNLDRPMMMTKC